MFVISFVSVAAAARPLQAQDRSNASRTEIPNGSGVDTRPLSFSTIRRASSGAAPPVSLFLEDAAK